MYTIFADNLIEASWFRSLSPLLSLAAYTPIGDRGSNPDAVEDLIRYDRPDIILLHGARPVLVVEKSREVPTGHNVGQRLARLVRSAEAGILTVMFSPFDARKHGDYSAICNLNIRLIRTFERMSVLHGVPVLAVNWPADGSGELVDDASSDERMSAIVDEFLRRHHDIAAPEIIRQTALMRTEYEARLRRYPAYGKPPRSVDIVPTTSLGSSFDSLEGSLAESFRRRSKTLVYAIAMSPAKCRREDPYTGTQFIYDYVWCRSGSDVSDKHTNLVLRFPDLTTQTWFAANPNDPVRKSCNWYLTANAIWLKDAVHLLR